MPLRANWNEVMTTNNLPVADVSLFFGYPLVAMPGGEGGMERKGMAALGSCVTSWLVKEKCGLLLKTKTKVRSQSGERRKHLMGQQWLLHVRHGTNNRLTTAHAEPGDAHVRILRPSPLVFRQELPPQPSHRQVSLHGRNRRVRG